MGVVVNFKREEKEELEALQRYVGYAKSHANSVYRYPESRKNHLLNCREELLRALKEIDKELTNGC